MVYFFGMCRPTGAFPHPLSRVKQQAGYRVMDCLPLSCFFMMAMIANIRVLQLHICLGISVVLGIPCELLFLYHTIGVCTHAPMLKVLWDSSSFGGSHDD